MIFDLFVHDNSPSYSGHKTNGCFDYFHKQYMKITKIMDGLTCFCDYNPSEERHISVKSNTAGHTTFVR